MKQEEFRKGETCRSVSLYQLINSQNTLCSSSKQRQNSKTTLMLDKKACDATSRCFTLLMCLIETLIEPILKWLRQCQTSPRYVPNAVEGTCKWIEQDKVYGSWVEDDYNKPLCIYGPLGSLHASVMRFPATDIIL
jgi:hypothetical protein